MGLNISGLVIDKNYNDDLPELETIISKKLMFEKEVGFNESIQSWKKDSHCDIFYSKKGTLILLDMERGGFEFYAKNQNTFSFVLSEMSETYCINYAKNGVLIRSIMESEGDIIEDEGKTLDFKDEEDRFELIFHLLEKTLGESFHKIDLDAKCFRYSYYSTEKATTDTEINKKRKPWWKLW